MIKKLYDFRQVQIPSALLQAQVTREELDAELHRMAARFTTIAPTNGPVQTGDVVALTFEDPAQADGVGRLWANVGKDFDEIENLLLGFMLEDRVQTRYAGRQVTMTVAGIKRLQVPALTDAHVPQLGIAGVSTLTELEDELFDRLAEGQRKRKFRGIMGIVSKAVMENTEFELLEDGHPWYQALHGQLMARLEALAVREGKSVDEVLPMAMRMPEATLEESRQALRNMITERARQAALGQACAQESGADLGSEESLEAQLERYSEYFEEAAYAYFAPKIQVERN